MNVPKTVINPEVLLQALSQQTEPLPDLLQQSLQKAGQALRNDQPEAAQQLRELIKQHSLLEAAYQTALEQWDEQYASKQRPKGLGATLENLSSQDWLFLNQVTSSEDWVTTAKKLFRRQRTQPTSSRLDKADRIVVMIAGGAALGGAIAQIPGAVVGASLAAFYGWCITYAKTKSAQNS